MIKKIIKYGTSVAVGVCIGAVSKSRKRHVSPSDRDNMWKGETREVEIPRNTANEQIEMITDVLQSDVELEFKFMENDLRDVRTKLQHGLSDARQYGHNHVIVEMHDRQRLRLLETITSFGDPEMHYIHMN